MRGVTLVQTRKIAGHNVRMTTDNIVQLHISSVATFSFKCSKQKIYENITYLRGKLASLT